jgi:hypothetical protein
MASVRFETGPRTGETVIIEKDKLTFGRQLSSDCVLNHPTVSREHFYIERNGGKYFLVDQGSGNGTLVNGNKVSWIELKHGARIQAGPFSFSVDIAEKSGPSEYETSPDENWPENETEQAEPGFDAWAIQFYPREYLEGIEHFNACRYFNAHETWEEIWLRSSGETRLFYQLLIQAAVGLHHFEQGNLRGARGMYRNVTAKLPQLPSKFMSLDLEDFSRQFKSFFQELIDHETEVLVTTPKPRPRIELINDGSDQSMF